MHLEGIKKAPKTWRGGRSSGQEAFKKTPFENIWTLDEKSNKKINYFQAIV